MPSDIFVCVQEINLQTIPLEALETFTVGLFRKESQRYEQWKQSIFISFADICSIYLKWWTHVCSKSAVQAICNLIIRYKKFWPTRKNKENLPVVQREIQMMNITCYCCPWI